MRWFTAKHPQTASLYQTSVASLAELGLYWPTALFELWVLDAYLPSHCFHFFQINLLRQLLIPNCKILEQATSSEMDFECLRASCSNCSSQHCHDYCVGGVGAGLRSECYSAWSLAVLGWMGGDSWSPKRLSAESLGMVQDFVEFVINVVEHRQILSCYQATELAD